MTKAFAARLVFLAALVGGLLLWSQQRRPRDLALQIDLTAALPGEIVELDVVVRRAGAPGVVEFQLHAAPGAADIETTLVYASRPVRRTVTSITLSPDEPALIHWRD